VETEVFRKARTDERFRTAATVWRKLTPNWISVLPPIEQTGLLTSGRW
jgi:hypothetical protein